MIIAVDGTAASGKGTLSKRLAKYYSLARLDTGLIYRALAQKIIESGIDVKDEDNVAKIAKTVSFDNLNSDSLRDERIGVTASRVAQITEVREIFAKKQNQQVD